LPNDRALDEDRVTIGEVGSADPQRMGATSSRSGRCSLVEGITARQDLSESFFAFDKRLFQKPVTRDVGVPRVSASRCNRVAFGGYSLAPFASQKTIRED